MGHINRYWKLNRAGIFFSSKSKKRKFSSTALCSGVLLCSLPYISLNSPPSCICLCSESWRNYLFCETRNHAVSQNLYEEDSGCGKKCMYLPTYTKKDFMSYSKKCDSHYPEHAALKLITQCRMSRAVHADLWISLGMWKNIIPKHIILSCVYVDKFVIYLIVGLIWKTPSFYSCHNFGNDHWCNIINLLWKLFLIFSVCFKSAVSSNEENVPINNFM